MEERLLLRGIALERAYIVARHHQYAIAVEPHLADPPLSLQDQATVTAGVATELVILQPLVQITFAGEAVDSLGQGYRFPS